MASTNIDRRDLIHNMDYENENDNDNDWENTVVPLLQSDFCKKRIEERKMVEEADHQLSEELFTNESLVRNEMKTRPQSSEKSADDRQTRKSSVSTLNFSKIEENEKKQKDVSQQIKETKQRNDKHKDTFGECDAKYDDYSDLEDKMLK